VEKLPLSRPSQFIEGNSKLLHSSRRKISSNMVHLCMLFTSPVTSRGAQPSLLDHKTHPYIQLQRWCASRKLVAGGVSFPGGRVLTHYSPKPHLLRCCDTPNHKFATRRSLGALRLYNSNSCQQNNLFTFVTQLWGDELCPLSGRSK